MTDKVTLTEQAYGELYDYIADWLDDHATPERDGDKVGVDSRYPICFSTDETDKSVSIELGERTLTIWADGARVFK